MEWEEVGSIYDDSEAYSSSEVVKMHKRSTDVNVGDIINADNGGIENNDVPSRVHHHVNGHCDNAWNEDDEGIITIMNE